MFFHCTTGTVLLALDNCNGAFSKGTNIYSWLFH